MKDKIRRDVANISSQEHCCMSSNIFIKYFELEASHVVIIPLQLSAQGHDKKYTLYPYNILAEKLYFALL
jgi:hypothetical protein